MSDTLHEDYRQHKFAKDGGYKRDTLFARCSGLSGGVEVANTVIGNTYLEFPVPSFQRAGVIKAAYVNVEKAGVANPLYVVHLFGKQPSAALTDGGAIPSQSQADMQFWLGDIVMSHGWFVKDYGNGKISRSETTNVGVQFALTEGQNSLWGLLIVGDTPDLTGIAANGIQVRLDCEFD